MLYTCSSLNNAGRKCLARAMQRLDKIFCRLREDEARAMRALTTESLMHKDQVKLRHRVAHGRLAKSCPLTLWTMDAKLYRETQIRAYWLARRGLSPCISRSKLCHAEAPSTTLAPPGQPPRQIATPCPPLWSASTSSSAFSN